VVEEGVVPDRDRPVEQAPQPGEQVDQKRAPGDHLLGDPGEPRDEGRDRPLRIHQGVEPVLHPPVPYPERGDLNDSVIEGARAGRLQVDDDERLVGERWRQHGGLRV
jgi:hypothetical protein